MAELNYITSRAAAKLDLLFNKPASDNSRQQRIDRPIIGIANQPWFG